MQQILINHSLHSQLTKAGIADSEQGNWGGRQFVLVAICKAMQLRLSHTLHPAAKRGVHMYVPLCVSGKWHNLHNLRTVVYISNF